jgi:hypothetical protein
MGVEMEEKIFTKLSLTSLFPKPVDESDWGAFFGEFRTNFILPNFIGLGNGITRGYGAIYGLFNPEIFNYDESDLVKNALKFDTEDISDSDLDLETIKVDEVPKPNKRAKKANTKANTKTNSRKLLSEEYDIEEFVEVRNTKKKTKPQYEPSDDEKFNTDEFHKKQHIS